MADNVSIHQEQPCRQGMMNECNHGAREDKGEGVPKGTMGGGAFLAPWMLLCVIPSFVAVTNIRAEQIKGRKSYFGSQLVSEVFSLWLAALLLSR